MFGKSERRSDYQRTARPIVAMARTLLQGELTAPHRHRRAQLIYAPSGVLSVETPNEQFDRHETMPSASSNHFR